MSLKSTKEQIIQLLADKDNRVIALSGKWGTGKSFMWGEVKAVSDDEEVKAALYASLFGLLNTEQIKAKLMQSALPSLEANPGLWDGAKQAIKTGIKVMESFHKGFAALNDMGLVFASAILRQKLIVLDDIERKHAKLNIDEVLGFIDEFTQQHGSRFVLILNCDQLDKREVWNVLREKVVDQELFLNTSPSEAFEIAVELTPSLYASRIRATIETCGLINIRIIRKVIKAVNRILGDRQGLNDAVLSRVIPSTVLLSAIHYKGIEDGPDFDFVLARGTDRDLILVAQKGDAETEDGKRKAKWKLLMRELGISSCDDFELLVADFLHSGLFDVSKIAEIIDRYVAEDDFMRTRNDCNTFFQRMIWNHTLTEAELLAEATELADRSHLLDAYMFTALHESISELPGGEAIADSALAQWIKALRAKDLKDVDVNNFFQRKFHPQIEAEFNSINAKTQANTTVLDVCISIIKNSGWGLREEAVLKSATVQDLETIIRTSEVPELMLFMGKMLDLCVNKQTYEKHFGSAMDNFVQACRNIVNDPKTGRLCKLIKILFSDSKLTEELNHNSQNETFNQEDAPCRNEQIRLAVIDGAMLEVNDEKTE